MTSKLCVGVSLKRFYKICIVFLLLVSVWSSKDHSIFKDVYKGERSIASDCNEMASAIIRSIAKDETLKVVATKASIELKHYQFKKSIWKKILGVREFEQFNEDEYFRLLELYIGPTKTENNLLLVNPDTIEAKLALIEAIQLKFSHFKNLPSNIENIEKLNAFKLKKLQLLMKKFDLSSKVTRENLEEFASEFFLILKGPPISLLDYFTKNKTTKMNERLFRALEEDLLIRGLRGTIEKIPEREKLKTLELARVYIKRVMKYKLWRYLVIPYDLPWVDRVKISDQLLEKILMDGLDKHNHELITELKRQNLIDHYERFRKVYRPVAFGVGFYYYYDKYQDEQKEENTDAQNNEQMRQKFIGDFDSLSKTLGHNRAVEKSVDDLKEIQFQRVLKKYKDQYHEDPSEEEYQELREKIFGNT